MKIRDIFGLAIRVLIGGVLFYAGFLKAVGPSAEFAAALAAYKILPSAVLTPFAMLFPYVEMWVGSFLITGFYTRQASAAAAALFVIFLVVLGSAQLRGIDLVSCGCFGTDVLSPHRTMMMDSVLLVFCLISRKFNKYMPAWSLDRVLG